LEVYAQATEPPDPPVAENEYCIGAKLAVSLMGLPIVTLAEIDEPV
jgi:hypothetical protein